MGSPHSPSRNREDSIHHGCEPQPVRVPPSVCLDTRLTWAHRRGTREDMHHMVWRRTVNASNVIVPKSNHLLVQEKPLDSGECLIIYSSGRLVRRLEQRKAELTFEPFS